ncbi:MAG: putative PurR-regulated permease PerM [Candidatus Woesearchaeota archaeon]|jgi:predicted PurR-regulated permease PerM
MTDAHLVRKVIASSFLLILTIIILFALFPYLKAILGAFILFVILSPLHRRLLNKGMSKRIAVALLMLGSLLVIILPLSLVVSLAIGELDTALDNLHIVKDASDKITGALAEYGLSSTDASVDSDLFKQMASYMQSLLVALFGNVTHVVFSFFIMYFILYYMLLSRKKLNVFSRIVIPFNKKNTERLAQEFTNITNMTIISSGVIAIVQGLLLTISFWIFGISGAVLWGFVAAILSFIPVIGAPIVWVPAVIIQFSQGNMVVAIGVLVFGIIISSIDNVIRPILNKQLGDMHPLTSFLGIIIGLPLFGMLGIVVGPLLINYFFLMMTMFKEEYLKE